MAGKRQDPFLKMMAGFTSNPKIDPLSDSAFRVHMKALDHSKLTISRGWIAEGVAIGFAAVTDCHDGVTDCHTCDRSVTSIIEELVAAGVWERDEEGGFWLHDWDEHQSDPPARTEEQREKDRERQRRHRDRQRDKSVSHGLSRESHSVSVSQSMSVVEQPQALDQRSSSPTSTRQPVAARAGELGDLLAALESTWPAERRRRTDSELRERAIFDAHRAGEIPVDLTEQARLYIDAHRFASGQVAGCPNLHRWIEERRWTDPLPVKAAKHTAEDFSEYDAGIIGGAA